jgi:hypothetical protein
MSQTIGQIYSDLLKEKFIKTKLKLGEIPAIEEVNVAIQELQEKHNNFNSPLLKRENYLLEIGETSSAKKMNGSFELVKSDLSVCIKSLLSQGNRITDIYDSTFTKLEGFERKLEKLQTKITSLLFESKNSERHEDIFHETFDSKDMIDLKNTTTEIDDLSNSVCIKATESDVVTLSTSSEAIQVLTLSDPAIISSQDMIGLEVVNLLNTTNNVWQHQITAREPIAQASVDIVIKIPSTSTEINKIIVDPASADIKTQVNMEIAYSKDGLNWIFPSGENKKRLLKRTTFDFQFIKADFWRLRLTKIGNDGFFGNAYAYNFGLKNLMFLGKKYEKINRNDLSVLYSKIIKPQKLEHITALNLKVCETILPNTAIKYELAPLDQNEISALEAGSLTVNNLKYYLASLADRDSFTLDMLKLISQPTINDILATNTIQYKNQRDNDYGLAYDITGISKTDTVLLRNTGDNAQYDILGINKKIENITIGWANSGLFYSTYVLIEDADGLIIDVGTTEIIVNGKSHTGKVRIGPGVSLITTLASNWHSIDLRTLPFNSETKVDPLYPYNHKYLIEGIGSVLYGRNTDQLITGAKLIDIIDPDSVYRQKHNNWKFKMRELSFEQFESQEKSTLDVFSYKVDNTNQERIVVKSGTDSGMMGNEKFSIITKIQNSNPVKGLILKASLSTEDLKSTPVLTEYLLKFR